MDRAILIPCCGENIFCHIMNIFNLTFRNSLISCLTPIDQLIPGHNCLRLFIVLCTVITTVRSLASDNPVPISLLFAQDVVKNISRTFFSSSPFLPLSGVQAINRGSPFFPILGSLLSVRRCKSAVVISASRLLRRVFLDLPCFLCPR